MKNHENKNMGLSSKALENANHHANPSRMKPEVAAMDKSEQGDKKKSESHGLLNPDKGADENRIHINGSTRIHRSDS